MRTWTFMTVLLMSLAGGWHAARAEDSPWSRISELSKKDTPQGNPELVAYLKTLTREQMLQAAREACEQGQALVPRDRWAEAPIIVGKPLMFYRNEQGGIDDAPLTAALSCIASKDEGELFRRSLVTFAEKFWWPKLTAGQRERSRQCFSSVLSDSEAPAQLRAVACRALVDALGLEYINTLYSDKNVQALRSDSERWRNLGTLLRTGEVKVEQATATSLESVLREVDRYTVMLSDLGKNDKEPQEVRDQAKTLLGYMAKWPMLPTSGDKGKTTESGN